MKRALCQGTTFFFSSHILSEVENICHTVAFIRDGRLIRVGPVHEVLGGRSHYVEAECKSQPDAAVLAGISGVRAVSTEGLTIKFAVEGDMDEAVGALSAFHVTRLISREPSLTDVFLGLYEPEALEHA